MTEKQCKDCKKFKPLSEFHKRKDSKDGYRNNCKKCRGAEMSAYVRRPEVREHRTEYHRSYRENNPEQRERERKRQREYMNDKRKNNKEYQEKEKAYLQKRKEDGSINAYNREYENKKMKEDIQYKLKKRLRRRIWGALKKYHEGYKYNVKPGSAVKDLGCSISYLASHLESQFYNHPKTKEAMTWDNWNSKGWHIDHKKPLSMFDLSEPEQFKEAVHYTNLQPMWAFENQSKGNKYIEE